jgi:hypothetical protein
MCATGKAPPLLRTVLLAVVTGLLWWPVSGFPRKQAEREAPN